MTRLTSRDRFVGSWVASPAARVFFGTRLLIWAAAVYAWFWFKSTRQDVFGGLGYATELWSRSDSIWFIGIAQHGYQLNGGEVFYPLYPLCLAVVGRAFGGHYVEAGIVVSLVCGAGSFALLYRLALPRLGADGARRALLYLAVFPMSLFLQAVYSESLYLLCAVGAFVLAERRRWPAAGAVIGLAMLTRASGLALLPAIGVLAWRSPERRRAVASLGVALVIAAVYPLWLQLKLHAPRSEFSQEAGWNRHVSHAGPFGGLWNALRAAWAGVEQIVTGDRTHAFWTGSHSDPLYVAAHNLEDFGFFVVFLALGIVAWRRFGAPYGLYVLVSLAIPLTAPHAGYPMLSMPRFCLTLFPAFLALASVAGTVRRNRFVVVTSCTFLGIAITQWVTGQWVS